MNARPRYGLLAPFIVVGCLVAGVEVDSTLGDDDGATGGAGATGQGGMAGASGGGVGKGGAGAAGSSAGDAGDAGAGDGGSAGDPGMGGTGTSGTGTSGAGTGGAGAGGAGAGGAGNGGGPGGKGGAAGASGSGGGPNCAGIKSGNACAPPGICSGLACGLADSGRRSCTCNATWSCAACDFTNSPYRDPPSNISPCPAGVGDGTPCVNPGTVCGPQSTQYCACHTNAAGQATWDCDAPPPGWGCIPAQLSIGIATGEPQDHLPLSPAEAAALAGYIKNGTGGPFVLPAETTHTHNIAFTPAELTILRSGGTVNVMSSITQGQSHTYTIECAP